MPPMRIYPLENHIMPYAWGSPGGLAEALDLPNPEGGPRAELWMGAHPKAPSELLLPEGSRPLDAMIASDPESMLGASVAARFKGRLPFLFKVLSAARPLSIQVHPGLRKAQRGFEKENELGLAPEAPERNYRDPNHKPELAVALTTFLALVGFRPPEEITAFGRRLGAGDFRRHFDNLERRRGRMELSVFFYALMTLPEDSRRSLIASAVEAAEELLEAGGLSPEESLAWTWVLELHRLWPEDIGVLSPLVFNILVLEPGQALFIRPGEPHAYLGGTALEIMANSDNVIRCALTGKHVDMAEFISVLGFDAGRPALAAVEELGSGVSRFVAEVPDFRLERIEVESGAFFRVEGPEILLCTEGSPLILSEGGSLRLRKGGSAFVCGSAASWTARGEGLLWRASVGPGPGG